MAYGDAVSKPYTAGGTPSDSLAGRDLGRAAVGGLTPMVQEVTHEITAINTIAPIIVTTAGTRVRLSSSSLPVRRVYIQSLATNTGMIVVGDANVVAGPGTRATPTQRGIALPSPYNYVTFEHDDLMDIYIDAQSSGDGVTVTYWT